MKKTVGRERNDLPVACSLSEPDLAKRRRELVDGVFSGTLRVEELEDGYVFGFPGSAEWAGRLVGVVNAERACCPFLTFGIHFEPEDGPISLRVTGPEGAKAFIQAELMASQSV